MPSSAPVVVMGVSGSGKTSVGEALAARLGLPFVDADTLHPDSNKLKMAAGTPLTDDDRRPWLDAVGALLGRRDVVVACSALRRVYRDRLRLAAPDLRIVVLQGERELLARRLGARRGHFMPVSLLDSQLATLEPPAPDEHPIVLDIAQPVERLVADVVRALAAAPVAAAPVAADPDPIAVPATEPTPPTVSTVSTLSTLSTVPTVPTEPTQEPRP